MFCVWRVDVIYTVFFPLINEITNNTKKTKNKILAIPVATPAIPVNPNTPAINAIIINVIDDRNII